LNLRKYRSCDAIAGRYCVTSGGTQYPTQTLTYNSGTSGNKKNRHNPRLGTACCREIESDPK